MANMPHGAPAHAVETDTAAPGPKSLPLDEVMNLAKKHFWQSKGKNVPRRIFSFMSL